MAFPLFSMVPTFLAKISMQHDRNMERPVDVRRSFSFSLVPGNPPRRAREGDFGTRH
jgi:hypothetical protein